jgi:hypothetical protein
MPALFQKEANVVEPAIYLDFWDVYRDAEITCDQ